MAFSHRIRNLCLAFFGLLTYGCSASPLSSVASQPPSGEVASATILGSIAALPQAARAAAAAQFGDLTFSEIYENNAGQLAALSIDGRLARGLNEALSSERVAALTRAYPRLVDYWRAAGLEPSAVLAPGDLSRDFQEAMNGLVNGTGAGARVALALDATDDSQKPICKATYAAIATGATTSIVGAYVGFAAERTILGAAMMLGGAALATAGGIGKDNSGCVPKGD